MVFEQSTRIPPLPSVRRQNLIDIIQSDEDSISVVWLPLILPKFLKVTKERETVVLSLMENPGGEGKDGNLNLNKIMYLH